MIWILSKSVQFSERNPFWLPKLGSTLQNVWFLWGYDCHQGSWWSWHRAKQYGHLVIVDTLPILPLCEFLKHSYLLIYIVYFKIVDSLFSFFKECVEDVDKTHYTDGSELTYKEKNHLIAFCTFFENYNTYYRTPPNYGQYVPLVHVLNHDNFCGDTLVRFSTITTSVHPLHTSKTSTSLLTTKLLLCFSTENPDELCASSDVL